MRKECMGVRGVSNGNSVMERITRAVFIGG
jgi:hypothetical protein